MVSTQLQGLPRRHEARPKKGTWRDRNGDPAEAITSQAYYPVTAECAECGGPITALGVYQPFIHDGAPAQDGGSWTL